MAKGLGFGMDRSALFVLLYYLIFETANKMNMFTSAEFGPH